eukprot:gene10267-2686_t
MEDFDLLVRIENPMAFQRVLEVVKDFMDSVPIRISKNNFQIKSFDALNTVLFDFTLKRNTGFHFITQQPKNEKIYGLNCKLFFEGIKKLKKTDGLILMFSETKVSMKINKPPNWSYQCNTSQLEITGTDDYELFENTFDFEILLKSSLLGQILSTIQSNEEKLSVKIDRIEEKVFIYFTTGNQISDSKITLSEDDIDGIEIHNKISMLNAEAYPMRIINILAKTVKVSDSCLLQIGNNQPLSVLFQLEDTGYFQFFVAPIQNDDFEDEN